MVLPPSSSPPPPPPLSSTAERPLSWREARIQMRDLLREYLLTVEKGSSPNSSSSSSSSSVVRSFEAIPIDDFEEDGDTNNNINNSNNNSDTNDKNESVNNDHANHNKLSWLLQRYAARWIDHDMDLYCGSLLCSTLMMIISIILFHRSANETKHNTYYYHHRSQLIGSIMLLTGSMMSTWIIRRRRTVGERDGDTKKRNAVFSLLRVLDRLLAQQDGDDDGDPSSTNERGGRTPFHRGSGSTHNVLGMRLSGNPLADIYSVYRFSSSVSSGGSGHGGDDGNGEYRGFGMTSSSSSSAGWYRIPSLLLVDGDFIALQNGDIAPSGCTLVTTASSNISTNNTNTFTNTTTTTTIKTGEMIQPLQAELRSRPPNICHPSFPPGRSSLSVDNNIKNNKDENGDEGDSSSSGGDSKKILHLCRNVRVFVVNKAPIYQFLRRDEVSHQSPQIHRKLTQIRSSLTLLTIPLSIIVTSLILLRYGAEGIALASLWHLPFLATLGVLPVSTPLVLILMEIVGSSRILSSAHPYVFSTACNDGDGDGDGDGDEMGSRLLLLHYILRGIRVRISPPVGMDDNDDDDTITTQNDKNNNNKNHYLVDFPPASTCLFERLGVITALAIVDDELACEPTSTPQQLLIPSSNGLKLLDLFPKFDDEQDMENIATATKTNGNGRGSGRVECESDSQSQFFDSDDDSNKDRERNLDRMIGGGGGGAFSRRRILTSLLRRNHARKQRGSGDGDISGGSGKFNYSSCHYDHNGASHSQKGHTGAGGGEVQPAQENNEVQFEDPNWWYYLPSLKCIGLGCLLINDACNNNKEDDDEFSDTRHPEDIGHTIPQPLQQQQKQKQKQHYSSTSPTTTTTTVTQKYDPTIAEDALAHHIRQFNPRTHLTSLSSCIGFATKPNSFGARGDITPFQERRRVHVVATRLLHQRMQRDRHTISIEESRTWGILCPDSTSVLVKDTRSSSPPSLSSSAPVTAGGNMSMNKKSNNGDNDNNSNTNNNNNNNANYQLLTLGDARVVVDFCSDAWQGENSTIAPLGMKDRLAILESHKNWSLADLEVTAFSYAPVPSTHEQRLFDSGCIGSGRGVGIEGGDGRKGRKHNSIKTTYLVDNKTSCNISSGSQKENPGDDWSLMRNQIFLGLLGSSVSPRREIAWVIDVCSEAGIRFAYFSPRNMRRTKELASQMGIEVSWNCAISLRPLDDGEETDEHRMISTYADWDVNARLPHGVADVKRHLKEVDNVPLLVSVFTDVTKHTTAEMVHVFQNYSDTVLAIGLSHVSSNDEIFSNSDLSIGISLFEENTRAEMNDSKLTSYKDKRYYQNDLNPAEVVSVCSIAAHSCVFNVSLRRGLLHLSDILSQGRGALNASQTSTLFMVTSYLSFSFFILLSTCTVSTTVPFIPPVGSALFLQLIVPLIGLAMTFTESNKEVMGDVPPKNDKSITFAVGEQRRLYIYAILKAMPPAIFPQLIYLMAIGCLMIELENEFMVNEDCTRDNWLLVIRCQALKRYSGTVLVSSGRLMLAELALCIIVLSSSFVFRLTHLRTVRPWKMNFIWIVSIIISTGLVSVYLITTLDRETLAALPGYFYLLALSFPFICVILSEMVKTQDMRHEKRADMLRRLQFETRLGMWSPK